FLEAQYAGYEVGRKHHYLGIEIPGGAVIKAARRLDFILGIYQLFLQVLEVLVGLEIRVVLSYGKQTFERGGELVFGLSSFFNISGLGRAQDTASGLGDVIKYFFFMLGVAFDGTNQIRNQVEAALELYGYIAPSLVYPDIGFNQTVISQPQPNG